jgi:WD40 repeat protein
LARHRYEGSNGANLTGDGALAITADISRPPTLWDVTTGGELASLAGAQGGWGVAFSPDGRRIAATSASGSVHLFECAICAPVTELRQLAQERAGHRLRAEERRTILGE